MTGRTLQAHPRHVVLSMVKNAATGKCGFRCTCGHRLTGMDAPIALREADGHLRFHESRGDSWTQEAGAL